MKIILFVIFISVFSLLGMIILESLRKKVYLWLPAYVWQRATNLRQRKIPNGPIHIIFCMVDHFEPIQNGSTRSEERARMDAWVRGFPKLADRYSDSNGRPVQHTWFYPGEAYDPEYLENLRELCRAGYGDIDLHHHHSYENSESLRQAFVEAIDNFSKHGALTIKRKNQKEHVYGFIHGNMALDNSRLDDRFCGVNDELILLKETGCYADFSAPTAPCRSQPRKINSIYYAFDDPQKPKSHNTGEDVFVGGKQVGDLMIIQGPLALNWKRRKYGIIPRIDNAEILKTSPGTPDRIDLWVKQCIHVAGAPDWIFVKVSCHGAQNENFNSLLGEQADAMYEYLEEQYRNNEKYRLHYMTAREVFNVVKAAEDGMRGNPFEFKDYSIPPYIY